mgnify:CR=1 FL=1
MAIQRSVPIFGVGFALAAAFSNGTVGVFSRKSFEAGMDHYEVAFWRCAIALSVATIMVFLSKGCYSKLLLSFRGSWRIAICSALGIFTLYHFETQAFNYASIPLVSILVFTGGIGAILLDVLILKEQITLRKMLAMAMVFTGGIAIVAGDGLSAGTTKGVLLSLAAGLGYASFIFAWKFFRLTSSKENFWWFLAYGCAMLSVPFILSEPSLPSTEALPSLISLGLIPSFLGFFCTILAVQHIEAYKTQVIESSEPLFSATFAILFFGEWLTELGMLAALIVILGAAITCLPEKKCKSRN